MQGTEHGAGNVTTPRVPCKQGQNRPLPTHGSKVENQGLSELTHRLCKG